MSKDELRWPQVEDMDADKIFDDAFKKRRRVMSSVLLDRLWWGIALCMWCVIVFTTVYLAWPEDPPPPPQRHVYRDRDRSACFDFLVEENGELYWVIFRLTGGCR